MKSPLTLYFAILASGAYAANDKSNNSIDSQYFQFPGLEQSPLQH